MICHPFNIFWITTYFSNLIATVVFKSELSDNYDELLAITPWNGTPRNVTVTDGPPNRRRGDTVVSARLRRPELAVLTPPCPVPAERKTLRNRQYLLRPACIRDAPQMRECRYDSRNLDEATSISDERLCYNCDVSPNDHVVEAEEVVFLTGCRMSKGSGTKLVQPAS